MQLFIRLPSSRTVVLTTEAVATVGHVRAWVGAQAGLPCQELLLSIGGRPLGRDHCTLADYGIQR
jgi:hypothetical protein